MRDRLIILLPEWLPVGLIPDPSLVWMASLVAVFALSIHAAAKSGLKARIMIMAGLWSFLGAHWGGRLLDLLTTPGAIIENPIVLLRFWTGGKWIFGALSGAALFGGLYIRWRKAPVIEYAEAAAPGIAMGYAVARIGCFLNGCCFGTPCDLPWAVRFPERTMAYVDHWLKGWVGAGDVLSLPAHPTQLYHAAVGVSLCLLLKIWPGKWPGGRLAVGLAIYGASRFFLQFVRGDRAPALGFLDVNQIFSLLFLLSAGLLWLYSIRR